MDASAARDALQRAAVEWAAGERGQELVDAAAEALASGLDTPTLRILAGAPRLTADEEARVLSPTMFEELGLDVALRLSEEAIIECARLIAADLLDGVGTPRNAVARLYGMFVRADYPSELACFSVLDDYYYLWDQGILPGPADRIDRSVIEAAEALARREEPPQVSLATLFSDALAGPTMPAEREQGRSKALRRWVAFARSPFAIWASKRS